MELSREELPYFLAFVLVDEATRTPTGKRQTEPMNGSWISRTNPVGMRGSDSVLRRAVCIGALQRVAGLPIEKAAVEVAILLGLETERQVNRIRVAYYKFRNRCHQADTFYGQFLDWRAWLLKSPAHTLQFFLDKFEREFSKQRRQKLEGLIGDILLDPVQRERHRQWVVDRAQKASHRIETGRWDPEADWQFLATDYWSLGRYLLELGDLPAAKGALENALAIWTTHGRRLPRVQAKAIPELEVEIARLAPETNVLR